MWGGFTPKFWPGNNLVCWNRNWCILRQLLVYFHWNDLAALPRNDGGTSWDIPTLERATQRILPLWRRLRRQAAARQADGDLLRLRPRPPRPPRPGRCEPFQEKRFLGEVPSIRAVRGPFGVTGPAPLLGVFVAGDWVRWAGQGACEGRGHERAWVKAVGRWGREAGWHQARWGGCWGREGRARGVLDDVGREEWRRRNVGGTRGRGGRKTMRQLWQRKLKQRYLERKSLIYIIFAWNEFCSSRVSVEKAMTKCISIETESTAWTILKCFPLPKWSSR